MNRRLFLGAITAAIAGIALNPTIVISPPASLDKIEMIRRLMTNAISTHDNLIEEALFGHMGHTIGRFDYSVFRGSIEGIDD